MAFYGTPSKACERCRQRKVKCDLRKPTCRTCERLGVPCPGYRDLVDVLFRDESARFTRNVRGLRAGGAGIVSGATTGPETGPSSSSTSSVPAPAQQPTRSALQQLLPSSGLLPRPLSSSAVEAGANFFLATYAHSGPPGSTDFHQWMSTTMARDGPDGQLLGTIIEAIGMAALSNLHYAPQLAAQSRVRYGQALMAANRALRHPTHAFSDATLATVILMSLYEFVSFDSFSSYTGWTAHIEGVAAVFRHRGDSQFDSAFGRDTFNHFRWQCTLGSVQLDADIPATFYDLDELLRARQHKQPARPDEIRDQKLGEICFRIHGLQRAIRSGRMSESSQAIYSAAMAIDGELESVTRGWSFVTVDDTVSPESCFHGKRHIYSDMWDAHAWNNWRCVRILVNRIAMLHSAHQNAVAAHTAVVRHLATDICISTASFQEHPHIIQLFFPLNLVASEPLVSQEVRAWTVRELRRVSAAAGYGKARLIADRMAKSMSGGSGSGDSVSSDI
ncbi:hypothetical protein QBC47DRAFT_394514 [Echria macrotheca]|uniref:Zn(2)-C6 fungal-type domain-containing protein n=1 Tax=Echria macrotheca TaxID=438768 RepID=A0AAJ0B359_9PEZI|nr:hypothetical protein QBC47DRAFT_394514 [Echria macrotheca]